MEQPIKVFVEDITLEEARAAIRDRPEFSEKEQDDLIIINYKYCNSRTFPDPKTAPDPTTARLLAIRRECRGLIFNKETKQLIARRYHKFFNCGELPETQEELIDLTRSHSILVKYDGSLITPVISNGKVRFASKGGFSNVSDALEKRLISRSELPYSEFSREWLEKGWTPIFEYCSPRFKIVLQYDDDLLILTAIRNNRSGVYLSYKEMRASAEKYKIPVAEVFEGTLQGVKHFQDSLKESRGIEGFVLRFEDGHFYKVKTEWYFERTKKDKQEFSVNSERSIWTLILEQQIDDAMSFLKDAHLQQRLKEFEDVFWSELQGVASSLSDFLNQAKKANPSLDRKDFVEILKKEQPVHYHPILLKLFEKTGDASMQDAQDVLIDSLKKKCSGKGFETAKAILNGIQFKE